MFFDSEVRCTAAEAKKAYRALCLEHHPDKGGDKAAFQQLQAAYAAVMEDLKKRGTEDPVFP